MTALELFILASVHLGMLAVISGVCLGTYNNWWSRRYITAVIGAAHAAVWLLAYIGVVVLTFTGTAQ